jgi:hypothetical protein
VPKPPTAYNLLITTPAIKNVITTLKAEGATITQIDADGTVHATISAADDWGAGQLASAIIARLGADTTATRN